MASERVSLGDTGVTLRVEDSSRSTVEQRPEHPDVFRFFSSSSVVVAASVHPLGGDAMDAVAEVSGDLIAAYRNRPQFERFSRLEPEINGAVDVTMLEFVWDDDSGVTMHSVAVVAADRHRVAVIHASFPHIHGSAALQEAEDLVSSCEFGTLSG